MNTLEFFVGGEAMMSPHDGGTHLECVEGRGEGSLPNYFGWEFILFIKTHFYKGALTLHFMEEHPPLYLYFLFSRWRHEMEICSALLALCSGNSQVTGEFPSQRPVTQSFDVFFDLRPTKRLSKQSRRRWFETPSCSLWRHCNVVPNSDPGSRGIFRRSTHHSCPILNWWNGSNWGVPCFMERMALKLAHCSTLITIP